MGVLIRGGLVAVCATVVVACYSPDLADCAVRCSAAGDCAGGMTCGAEGLCRLEGARGTCADVRNDGGTPLGDDAGLATVEVEPAGAGAGRVTSQPAGIDCGTACSAAFPIGQQLTLTASPGADSLFDGWSAACEGQAQAVCSVVVGADLRVGAAFVPRLVQLSIVVTGRGRVVDAAQGIQCIDACQYSIERGAALNLVAQQVNPSRAFLSWTAPGCDADPTCILTLTDDLSVTANFEP
jgi:hypothetical protein